MSSSENIRDIYSKTANSYDLLLKFYRALGVNLEKWRQDAIIRLPDLRRPRILDVGVGTGSNLPHLIRKYPDYNEIVGVDYTPAMLSRAKERISLCSWERIHLRLMDAKCMSEDLPGDFDLIISTYSLSIIPGSRQVLREIKKLLNQEGYLLLLDCQKFKGLLRIYNPLAIFLSTRLGGNNETYSVPVSDIAAQMFRPIQRKLLYSGLFYEDLYQL